MTQTKAQPLYQAANGRYFMLSEKPCSLDNYHYVVFLDDATQQPTMVLREKLAEVGTYQDGVVTRHPQPHVLEVPLSYEEILLAAYALRRLSGSHTVGTTASEALALCDKLEAVTKMADMANQTPAK